MNRMKRALSILLATLLLLTSMPLVGLAEYVDSLTVRATSVTAQPVEIIEHTDGYWYEEQRWNEEEQRWEDIRYWNYYNRAPSFTVTMEDGTVVTNEYGGSDICYNGEYYYLSYYYDQSYDNPWGVGTHTVEYEILGCSGTFDVVIVESPVDSIAVQPIEIIENTQGSYVTDYVYGQPLPSYWRYDYSPEFAVTLKDGSVLETIGLSVNYGDRSYDMTWEDDQQYSDPWGLGTHTVEYELLGYSGSFNVEIVECPVASVTVQPIEIIEKTNGYWHSDSYWEDDTRVETPDYWRYEIDPRYSVTLKDGTVLDSEDGIYYNGEYYWLDYYTDQSYTDQWGLGTYTVEYSILGYSGSFDVEIVESPVASVTVQPIEILQNTRGYWDFDLIWDDENHVYEVTPEYWHYNFTPEFSVTLKDGTVLQSEFGFITYNGADYPLQWYNTQSYDNQWGVGTHTVECDIFGYRSSFDVEILDTPVASIAVQPIEIIENTGGRYVTDYVYGEECTYWQYSYRPQYAVTLKDGTVLKSDWGYIQYGDSWYSLDYNDGQCGADPWGIGTHTVEYTILGYDGSFDVEIVESPYTAIEVVAVQPLEEKTDAWGSFNGYSIYNAPKFSYKLYKKDGSYEIGHFEPDDEIGTHNLSVVHNQYEQPWVVDGNNEFTVSFGGVSTTASAIIKPIGGYEYILQDDKAIITACHLTDSVLEIPDTIDGYSVIGISSLGAASATAEYITVSNGVRYLDAAAFNGCAALRSVSLGCGIEAIDPQLFASCPALVNVWVDWDNENYCDMDGVVYTKDESTLVLYPLGRSSEYRVPETVTNLDVLSLPMYSGVNPIFPEDHSAYVTVDGVTYTADMTMVITCDPNKTGKYEMPDTVTDIAEGAFWESSLSEVVISQNVTELVYRTFSDNYNLTSVELPPQLVAIGSNAFYACESLQSIDLPDSLARIDSEAFAYSGLQTVEIPAAVEVIGNRAFTYSDLQEVTFAPHSALTDIDSCAFLMCESLTSATLPDGLERIGEAAFYGCYGLDTIVIPDSVTSLGDSAFSDTGLESVTIGAGLTELPDSVFNFTNLVSVDIPSNIKRIGAFAFNSCSSLESIVIPDTVKTIGEYAFAHCQKLAAVTFGSGLQEIAANAFTYAAIEEITIPKNIIVIGDYAFMGCRKLANIALHDDITDIGRYAFSGTAIKSVQLSNKLQSIAAGAFSNTALTEIALPASVTELQNNAFYNSTDLADISVTENVLHVGSNVFGNTAWFASQPDGAAYIDHILYRYKGDVAAGSALAIKEGTTVIAGNALSKHDTPVMVTDYVYYAWESMPFASITLPDTLKIIGDFAFYGCDEITSLEIPASVSSIGYQCFIGCDSLEQITVDADNAYYTDVDGVLFSKDMTELIWCPKRDIDSYVVPFSVERIHTNAFLHSGVKKVTIYGRSVQLDDRALGYALSAVEEISCVEGSTAEEYAYKNLIAISRPEQHIYSDGFDTDCDACGAQRTLESIAVTKLPNKTRFEPHTALDTTGMELTLTYSDGSAATVNSGFAVSGFDSSELGTSRVTVSVGDKTTYFDVRIAYMPTVAVDSKTVKAGDEFTVNIRVKHNPGIIAMQVLAGYDRDAFELISAVGADFAGVAFGQLDADLFAVNWVDSIHPNNTTDGVLATLTFRVKEDAKAGHHTISLSYDEDNIHDYDFNNVEFAVQAGTVTVQCREHSYGGFAPATETEHSKTCSVCGHTVTAAHDYDNTCDTTCNVCSAERAIEHTYAGACDSICDVCGDTREVTAAHDYDNTCDTTCNVCGAQRAIEHTYAGACDDTCDVCSDTREVTAEHSHDHACDTTCNVCGAQRAIEHTYAGACDDTCDVCGDTREVTAAHDYDNTCDTTCDACGAQRAIEHTFAGACDSICDVCDHIRETSTGHTYDNAIDAECSVCGYEREITFTGWIAISGKWAYYELGVKVTLRWVKDSVGWCYLGADGFMKTNAWVQDSVGWCYVGANGYAVTNCWKKDSVGWCYLNANGSMTKNKWVKDGGKWYYLDAVGYMMANKWMKDSVGWVYLGSSGAMLTNAWVRDSVGWCYVGGNGYAVTNCWKKDSVGWCYLNASGSMTKNAWVKDGGKWYYLNGNGYMVTGRRLIGGKYYTFNSSGVWVG